MSKLVYICSPYGGKEENLELARRICKAVVERGDIPIAPHLLFPQFMNEETERDESLTYAVEILKRCDIILIYYHSKCGFTGGMKQEVTYATALKKPLEYMYEDE